uniref:Uncharacterized protein n=1 Tax=Tanacetum cinerariifolium TaxID=118510 RepID=A0A699JXQ6_TANCI|nr:hypothetical protein [Tanacetum cinerariifolium]
MNPQETEHVITRDEAWVPAAERVKISPTNVRLETTVQQKEETFQVVIDLIKNSTCLKAFIISADLMLKSSGRYLISIQEMKVKNLLRYKMMKTLSPFSLILATKLKFQHYHTIKDDGIVSRLKYVRIGEDYQEYGLSIPETMLNVDIVESESYQRFLLYSTGSIPPKKSRGKGYQGKKTRDTAEENVDVSEEPCFGMSSTEPEEEVAARQVHATHARIVSQKLKGVQTLTPEEQKATDIMKALKESRITSKRQPDVDAEKDDEETESDSEDIYKYKIKVCKDADEEMKDANNVESENKKKEEMTDAAKVDAKKTMSLDYGDQFLDLSHSDNLPGVVKDSPEAESTPLLDVHI